MITIIFIHTKLEKYCKYVKIKNKNKFAKENGGIKRILDISQLRFKLCHLVFIRDEVTKLPIFYTAE